MVCLLANHFFMVLMLLEAEENFGGEVVGISVEPGACSECAQGIALSLSFGGEQEVEVVYAASEIVQTFCVLFQECSGNNDLVEQIP